MIRNIIAASAVALALSIAAAPASARISANGVELTGLAPEIGIHAAHLDALNVELPSSLD
ncbi:MAG TPA: hypothetical protein VIG36_03570 [Methylocystis sp.]|jgi:hypothetical protein